MKQKFNDHQIVKDFFDCDGVLKPIRVCLVRHKNPDFTTIMDDVIEAVLKGEENCTVGYFAALPFKCMIGLPNDTMGFSIVNVNDYTPTGVDLSINRLRAAAMAMRQDTTNTHSSKIPYGAIHARRYISSDFAVNPTTFVFKRTLQQQFGEFIAHMDNIYRKQLRHEAD